MISFNFVWLVLLISYIAVVLLLVIFSLVSKKTQKDFSYLRYFPSELTKENPKLNTKYFPMLYAFTILSFSPILFIVPQFKEFGDLGILTILISCMFGLQGIVIILLHSFEVKYSKVQVILSTILMGLSFLTNALVLTISFLTIQWLTKFNQSFVLQMISLILSGLCAIATLIVMANPKLGNWAELIADGSGETQSFKRPKIFILAFSQWICMLLSILGEIAFFLSLIS